MKKTLLHTLLLLVFKTVENLQCILNCNFPGEDVHLWDAIFDG